MTMAGKVLVLNVMTLTTKSTIDVGDMPAVVTFAKHAFGANGMYNDVTVIDVATKKASRVHTRERPRRLRGVQTRRRSDVVPGVRESRTPCWPNQTARGEVVLAQALQRA